MSLISNLTKGREAFWQIPRERDRYIERGLGKENRVEDIFYQPSESQSYACTGFELTVVTTVGLRINGGSKLYRNFCNFRLCSCRKVK